MNSLFLPFPISHNFWCRLVSSAKVLANNMDPDQTAPKVKVFGSMIKSAV